VGDHAVSAIGETNPREDPGTRKAGEDTGAFRGGSKETTMSPCVAARAPGSAAVNSAARTHRLFQTLRIDS
jgi:hypothetical protein